MLLIILDYKKQYPNISNKLPWIVIIIITTYLIMINLLTGCNGNNGSVAKNIESNESKSSNASIPSNWPKGIPEDILPLPGTIDKIMETENRVRLFYSGVSRKDISDYVSKMENNDFKSKYEVYVKDQPGITNNAGAKTNQLFDGALLTKGKYYLRITVDENGGATYNMDGIPKRSTRSLCSPTRPLCNNGAEISVTPPK
jgi:hypothetical protein